MDAFQIENNVQDLIDLIKSKKYNKDNFIFDLLASYGLRKQSINRLKSGERNLSKNKEEIIWTRKVYFKNIIGKDVHGEAEKLAQKPIVIAEKIRFVVVTNTKFISAIDTKTGEVQDISLDELTSHYDFFLPWAGMEKSKPKIENLADIKAAEKMAKLFNLLIKNNPYDDINARKALNIFLTRLLFCFFAEDTDIFQKSQFSSALISHTREDGIDTAPFLERLFRVLNLSENNSERDALPAYLKKFPFVNGGLFADNINSPLFSRESRRILIECGSEL